MINSGPTFDLQWWQTQFPWNDPRVPVHLLPGVRDPLALAHVEEVRSRVFHKYAVNTLASIKTIPVDVFVFGLGDPPKPWHTKLGGHPFRPAKRPWPTNKAGVRLRYIAQIFFGDSMDILPFGIPGNVMLVFVPESLKELCVPGAGDEIQCEWYDYETCEGSYVAVKRKPSPVQPHLFGVRHRTCDYDELENSAVEQVIGGVERLDIEKTTPEGWNWLVAQWAEKLACIDGMKIGGRPIGSRSNPRVRQRMEEYNFICSVTSFSPSYDMPYPYVNHPEAVEIDAQRLAEREIMMAHGFIIDCFLDRDSQTRAIVSLVE